MQRPSALNHRHTSNNNIIINRHDGGGSPPPLASPTSEREEMIRRRAEEAGRQDMWEAVHPITTASTTTLYTPANTSSFASDETPTSSPNTHHQSSRIDYKNSATASLPHQRQLPHTTTEIGGEGRRSQSGSLPEEEDHHSILLSSSSTTSVFAPQYSIVPNSRRAARRMKTNGVLNPTTEGGTDPSTRKEGETSGGPSSTSAVAASTSPPPLHRATTTTVSSSSPTIDVPPPIAPPAVISFNTKHVPRRLLLSAATTTPHPQQQRSSSSSSAAALNNDYQGGRNERQQHLSTGIANNNTTRRNPVLELYGEEQEGGGGGGSSNDSIPPHLTREDSTVSDSLPSTSLSSSAHHHHHRSTSPPIVVVRYRSFDSMDRVEGADSSSTNTLMSPLPPTTEISAEAPPPTSRPPSSPTGSLSSSYPASAHNITAAPAPVFRMQQSRMRAYLGETPFSTLHPHPTFAVGVLATTFIMVCTYILQHHVLDTKDHIGLFFMGSYVAFSSYFMVHFFLEKYSTSFRKISQDKKFYTISNIMKASMLAAITPFALSNLYLIIVHDSWDTNTLRNLGCVYAIPDFVSLLVVKRMAWTTVFHHVCVFVFNVFSIHNDYNEQNVCRLIVVYAAFSTFAYVVNMLLASRFLGVSGKVSKVLAFLALSVYVLCCAINWTWQAHYLRRLIKENDHWTIYLYMMLICFVMWDDIVLNKWLLRNFRNSTASTPIHSLSGVNVTVARAAPPLTSTRPSPPSSLSSSHPQQHRSSPPQHPSTSSSTTSSRTPISRATAAAAISSRSGSSGRGGEGGGNLQGSESSLSFTKGWFGTGWPVLGKKKEE